jgi:hypothetical protein
MSAEEERIERLIAMAERLIEVLEGDIAALRAGKPRDMRSIEPEILRLSALYSREASGLNPNAAKSAPAELRRKLFDATGRFKELLGQQMRLLTRMRGATEGMVRAVAEEIERRRAPLTPYGATARAPRQSGAMLYNSVV